MEKYLYLAINIGSVSIPFLASFYSKAPFYKKWKHLWIAILLPALFFVIWDELFTSIGVWGFNPRYITGIYLGNLPIEEVLFFFCIPYASVFIYFALNHLVEKDYLFPHQELISSGLIISLLVAGMYFIERKYTGVTFVLLALFMAFQMLRIRPRYMGRFYLAFAVVLIPFFIVNGLLTGSWIDEEVVWYNDRENLGIRIGTIPIEDAFYGMLMILMNVVILEWLEERERRKAWRNRAKK